MEASPSCARFSAAVFFKDSPWLQIPEDRRGEILIEPLYACSGLLGGSSSTSGPKVSKLAALAAARKKKENDHPSGGVTQNLTSSVALLDKLSGKANAAKTSGQSQPNSNISGSDGTPSELSGKSRDRKYPVRRRNSSSQPVQAKADVSDVQASEGIPTEPEVPTVAVSIPTASPSDFAKTMFGSSGEYQIMSIFSESSKFSVPFDFTSSTEPNPFAGPSPDDIVTKAQNSKGSTQRTRGV